MRNPVLAGIILAFGMPSPILCVPIWVRSLAIGGDLDAAISQEEVIKKMTSEQIRRMN